MKVLEKSHLIKLNSNIANTVLNERNRYLAQGFISSIVANEASLLQINGAAGYGKSNIAAWICKSALALNPMKQAWVAVCTVPDPATLSRGDLLVIDDVEHILLQSKGMTKLTKQLNRIFEIGVQVILICDYHLRLKIDKFEYFEISLGPTDSSLRFRLAHDLATEMNYQGDLDSKLIYKINTLRELESYIHKLKILNEIEGHSQTA